MWLRKIKPAPKRFSVLERLYVDSLFFLIFNQDTSKVIQSKKEDLGDIDSIGAQMEEAMILDNK